MAAAHAAPRCIAHSSRSGLRCKKPAIKGAVVCMTHGGNAPQVREAARLRLACLVAPALQVVRDIMADKHHPQRLAAAREVLERSQLYAHGVTPPTAGFHPSVTVQTQVNMPEAPLASMSDEELARYKDLLLELRALAPKEELKRITNVAT